MSLQTNTSANASTNASVRVPAELIDAIRSFPTQKEFGHCGQRIAVSALAMYGTCPHCGTRVKLRAFSAATEIEDVFDAVFAWMNQPAAQDAAQQRRQALSEQEE